MPPTAPDAPASAHAPAAATTNVLLIGGGAREHALAWKLRQSPRLGTLWTTDATNPGIAALAQDAGVAVDLKDTFRLTQFCTKNRIGLVVIGPEEPLAGGLADILTSGGGGLSGAVPAVFGPSKAGAALEADKAFAKDLMRGASIPTAEARVFTDPAAAHAFIESRTEPYVIKAAGLAKGKGVILPSTQAEAAIAVDRIMTRREFGDAGKTVVIEERLKGREVSVFALIDGKNIYMLESCQDHKRLLDGAQGPNTGGMGSLCPPHPTAGLDERTLARIEREVIVPTVDALRRDNIDYRGVLYAGIMLTPAGPKVLEYNCRFGDPECQTLMSRLDADLLAVMLATSNRSLDKVDIAWKPGCAVCVVLAAPGYPDKPKAGLPITGLDEAAKLEHVQIFHAGTRRDDKGQIVTAGGRVLSVTATGGTLAEARARAYAAADIIKFDGKQQRSDIGTEIVG